MDLEKITDIQIGFQGNEAGESSSIGMYSLIQGKDFDSSGRLRNEAFTKIPLERDPQPYLVTKDDILFQARGSKHFAYRIEKELSNTLSAYTFYVLRLKSDVIRPGFLAWWLNQSAAQMYLQARAGTSNVSFISVKTLGRLEIPIVPLETQEKTEHLVALREKEEKLLCRLSELRSILINAICRKKVNQGEQT